MLPLSLTIAATDSEFKTATRIFWLLSFNNIALWLCWAFVTFWQRLFRLEFRYSNDYLALFSINSDICDIKYITEKALTHMKSYIILSCRWSGAFTYSYFHFDKKFIVITKIDSCEILTHIRIYGYGYMDCHKIMHGFDPSTPDFRYSHPLKFWGLKAAQNLASFLPCLTLCARSFVRRQIFQPNDTNLNNFRGKIFAVRTCKV